VNRGRSAWFLAGGLLVALLLAGVVSSFASASPDGLDAAARRGCTVDSAGTITGGTCMAQQERDHQLEDSPLAGYGIRGIDNPYVSTGLSGVLGVLVTFALGAGVFRLARRRGTASPATTMATTTATDAPHTHGEP
jgi:cobalt/nickel transport protein